MDTYTSNGVSLSLVRDVRKKDPKDICPIRWRVTFQRKQIYYSTGVSLNLDEWDLLINESRKKEIKAYRETFQDYYVKTIHKQVKDLVDNGIFSFDLLNVRLSKSVGEDVKQAFRTKIQRLIDNDKIGNASIYQCTLKSIENYNSKTILFSDITPKWLDKFQTFLVAKPIRYATIGIYLRTLRAIINDAKDSNIINASSYPFGQKDKGKFEIPSGGGRELSLTLKDVRKISKYKCPSKTIELSRDLWIFSYYCNGANFGDILRFKNSDIKDGEIYFYRKKTKDTTKKKIEIIVPILPIMQTILDKWGNTPTKTNYIFPFLNNCKTETEFKKEIYNVIRLTNKKIKLVTKAIGLPDISTYNARHSYATILTKLRVPESYIAESLGHADSTVTQSYFGHYDKQERMKYNSLLLWNNKWKTKRQIIRKRKQTHLEK